MPDAAHFSRLSALLAVQTRSLFEPRQQGGIVYLAAKLPPPFQAVLSTRVGGVSRTPYGSLNLSDQVGDALDKVLENRMRLLDALASERGFTAPQAVVLPEQTHGTRIAGLSEYHHDGAGTPCDGLVLHPLLDCGLAGLLVFADCLPVVMVGEVDLAAVHAGWRGLLGGVVQEGARAMTSPPGFALVGPSIGPCCYTVGADLADAFAERYGPGVVRPGPRVDLWEAAARAFAEVGIPRTHVVTSQVCTCCHFDLFYSQRAEGPVVGRHGLLVWTDMVGR